MSGAKSLYPITPDRFDAVLFDRDGVLTATAKVHAICWKKMFDEYLQNRASRTDEPFQPFEITTDYRLYVNGKPRFDGVRDFLRSRGIELPEGSPADPPQTETVCGLGNHKNEMINAVIEPNGEGGGLMIRHEDEEIHLSPAAPVAVRPIVTWESC